MLRNGDSNGFYRALISGITFLMLANSATLFAAEESADESNAKPVSRTHMSEAHRSSLRKVVVLPTTSPTNQGITGSYDRETPGLLAGAQKGGQIGTISKEFGGVLVTHRIGILTLPGMIVGGLSGKAKERMQNFRDSLTDDLANSADQPLTNDALASDVYWGLRDISNLDPKVLVLTTPIPGDTDAILYVSLTGVMINVEKDDAVITTSASASLRRVSDGEHLYEKIIEYQDRDTLKNWTKDENALWRDYANFSRHYIAREISAEVFGRVNLRHELRPQETDTVASIKKNDWQGLGKSLTPTLAWELNLLGDDSYGAWADNLGSGNISYEVEIYDMHRLVYAAKRVQEPRHTVERQLEACQDLRWSVRPSYRVGDETRYGEWMRFDAGTKNGNGNVGRRVSEAPAYTQDFASLKIKCRLRQKK